MMKRTIILILILSIFLISESFAKKTANYLLLGDIGSYKFKTQNIHPLTKKVAIIPGYTIRTTSGILAGADHFDMDHNDIAYETVYESDVTDLGVRVQITQHTGADSDKWLLHEVDTEFRNYYGIPVLSYTIQNINGNYIYVFKSGGWDYRWVSGNKIVAIDATDLMMENPEPLEVVKAYLEKHPSTLPSMTLSQLRNTEQKTKWIKNEMERRLWLCDKWLMQLQLGKVDQRTALKESVDHMGIFLTFRDKYYGVDGEADARALVNYRNQNNGTMIKNKLEEYKKWWTANKENPISL